MHVKDIFQVEQKNTDIYWYVQANNRLLYMRDGHENILNT